MHAAHYVMIHLRMAYPLLLRERLVSDFYAKRGNMKIAFMLSGIIFTDLTNSTEERHLLNIEECYHFKQRRCLKHKDTTWKSSSGRQRCQLVKTSLRRS
ncbi:hypothetical protein T4B_3918 [Trichinella pseudospiralis]|uniref:Uncharacterized protein n=1 Tax=Trichinella pseudospiralis TaxID=6337 RepID=A0A0V1J0P4_TRIPS|nr:hypothetical protein T4B_3918 [Trichinella pseudospiralis]